jgi:multidrug efflux system membrane fusion protein
MRRVLLGLGGWGVAGMLLAAGGGCQRAPAPVLPPPAEVTVSQPVAQPVTESLEFTGTTAALESVDIRARVTGFLEKVHFQPRAKVNPGDVLFTIDPRPFQNALDQAKAAESSLKAQLAKAQWDLDKEEDLIARGAASQDELTTAITTRDSLAAQVGEAQARVSNAQLNLDFCTVTAPIHGRISRTLLDPGNLVAADNTVLASIVNDEDIYAYFNASERDVLTLREQARQQLVAEGKAPQSQPDIAVVKPPVFLGLMTEDDCKHPGYIDYTAPALDPSTGTIQVRARFPNADGQLLAGLFVRLRTPLGAPRPALLVAERALGSDQGQRYVLVANAKNVVEYRPVKIGGRHDRLRVITDGLRADDWVIVNGLQRVRPGVTVKPIQAPPETAPRPDGANAPPARASQSPATPASEGRS